MAIFNLTPVGKLFFASLIAYIVHDTHFNWKIKGDPKKIEALAKAVVSSKRFQQEMKKPGATVDSVIDALNLKNLSAREFEKLTGLPWPV